LEIRLGVDDELVAAQNDGMVVDDMDASFHGFGEVVAIWAARFSDAGNSSARPGAEDKKDAAASGAWSGQTQTMHTPLAGEEEISTWPPRSRARKSITRRPMPLAECFLERPMPLSEISSRKPSGWRSSRMRISVASACFMALFTASCAMR